MQIETEQIQVIRNEVGEIVAFWIIDMSQRQTNMYTVNKVGFGEVKEIFEKLFRENQTNVSGAIKNPDYMLDKITKK